MKRFIMILSSALLIASSAFGEPGNTDGIGGVDLKDVIMSLQVCAGLTPAGVSVIGAVNNNGKIGLEEAIYGLQLVAGLRIPENLTVWYKDADGDGYSDGTFTASDKKPGDAYYTETELIATSGDTDDNDPKIFPVGAGVPTEISRIQTGIQTSGAGWIAETNPVSALPNDRRKIRLGALIPSDVTARDKKTYALRENLPASFDWRNNNGNFVTPVKDQGDCGSCWSFSTTAVLESQVLKTLNQSNSDLSEQIALSCSGAGDCNGGYIDDASNFLKNTGISAESCYPYTEANGNCNNACANWRNSAYRIDSWNEVYPTVSDIKNAIYTTGPVVTAFYVYTDFYYYTSGVYSYTWGSYQGGHAVVIVGWDDSKSCFIVKNSWGTGWGESGYFRIAYSQVTGKSRFGFWTIAYSKNPCSYTVLPVSNSVSSSAVSGSISVTSPYGCNWTAVSSNTDWLTISSGISGNGNGTVNYSVAANTGRDSRTGTMAIAGQTFTVTQAGVSCASSIKPTIESFIVSGGNGTVIITAPNVCSWTATSNDTWIIISSGSTGTGNGTVTYSVSANPNLTSRTGTLTIAGQTFTVSQAGRDSLRLIWDRGNWDSGIWN